MMPKPKKKREPVVTDYLLEKRKEKEEKEYNDSYSQNDNKVIKYFILLLT